MKDLHSHLLYGIDDGSKSLEESISLLKKMQEQNITDLMCTPHYIEDSQYVCNNKDKNKILRELKKSMKKENININIYLGNELFITPNVTDLIKKREVKTLKGSRYVLFEFPMNNVYLNTKEIILKMTKHRYIPILAHPERYPIFQKHPEKVEEYLKMGVLLQGNMTSLFGKYGWIAQKTIEKYIKKGWISFLGSDTHHDFNVNYKKLEKKLHRLNKDNEYINKILYANFDKVINDEDIQMIR